MKCASCGAELPASARFCQVCGASVALIGSCKRAEVDLSWLTKCLSAMDYTAEINDATAICKHATRPTVVMGLLPAPHNLMTLQIHWNMPPVPLLKRWDFAQAINKASGANWLASFTYGASNLTSTGAMFLSEEIQSSDVAGYVDSFISCSLTALETSGLIKFG